MKGRYLEGIYTIMRIGLEVSKNFGGKREDINAQFYLEKLLDEADVFDKFYGEPFGTPLKEISNERDKFWSER